MEELHFMHARSGPSTATLCAIAFLSVLIQPLNAVIVRGTVKDPLGAAVPGARVQLMQGKTVAGSAVADSDGSYEVRSTGAGRFILFTNAATFTPAISEDFYGGRTDIVSRNVTLKAGTVSAEMTVTATGIATPIEQASSAITLVPFSALQERVGVIDDLRQSPGVAAVQSGQYGGVASLFVRGGNSDANKVMVDGITAEDVGGRFDYSTVGSTAIDGFEMF